MEHYGRVMSTIRDFAVTRLDIAARPDSLTIGVLDESGQEKKGTATASVKRQHMGCVDGINTVVYLAYIRAGAEHALIGPRQWIPAEQISDPVTAIITSLPLEPSQPRVNWPSTYSVRPTPTTCAWTS
ncbi:hypothetical protein ACIHFD_04525 [Nonomuraea sp. NPDC051941]|uniref:hypothetical protein n=1 Tax=Nonomuraea sp. NPDC051941 TaxID=3364373 RepID=UPI0037C81888